MSDDRLQLVRELSRSGIATVWEGYDQQLDRKVLVKSIHPQFARDADLRIRFEREARAIARLSHPNVVQIYDIRAGDESLSLLLEYVEGETLGHLLKRRGVLPGDLAIKLATDILAGLAQAHAGGIIHRDLKPENILISQTGVVKITDFGLASLRDLPAVTMEGAVIGTPSYMSPEQALGGAIGPRTDIFACGAMLFEMLTGRRLILGDSLGEAFQNVMKYRVPDLSVYAAAIPETFRPLLLEMIERDPEDRPATAIVAHAKLLEAVHGKPGTNADLAAFMSGTDHSAPVAAGTRTLPNKMLFWYGAAGILLVLTVIALVFSPSPEPPTTLPDVTQRKDSTTIPAQPQQSDTTTPATRPDSTRANRPKPADTTNTRPQKRAVDTSVVVIPDRQPPRPSGPAYVTINSTPWARVFYNDSLLGTTPLTTPLALPAGLGTLLFLNDQLKQPVTKQIDVAPGDTTAITVNLQDYVARVKIASVKPWADVFVDGELRFRTPSTQVIFLPLGRHIIELRHPSFPIFTKELTFQAGDPIYEVRVDLSQR
ncbi:MAG: serine/threonine protein kinase [bacterium]|nr:serine/threonine protein kinase [bacterium]